MIKIWKRYLPISLGFMLSIAAVIFLLEAIRAIDFLYLPDNLYALLDFIGGAVLGLIGFPLVLSQLDKLSRDD